MNEYRKRADGSIVDEAQLRALQPGNVGLPNVLDAATLDHLGYDPVLAAPQPAVTAYQRVVRATPAATQDGLGHWVQAWTVVDFTPDEIAAAQDAATLALEATYEQALVDMFDTTAQADRWDNRITCISRAGYPGPYQTRAQAFGTWMDTCAEQGYALLAAVRTGAQAMPTVEAFLAGMPPFTWPTPLTGDE